jgi:hypothetical protein
MNVATSAYPTALDALNIAIEEADDGGGPAGMAGNILNPEINPQVLPTFQYQWIYLQQRLISAGVDDMTKERVVFNLTPGANPNPRVPVQLTPNGYFNGEYWTGPNVTAPSWNDAITYTQSQTVTFSNIYYVALPNNGTNLNQEPDSSPLFWQPFNNIGPTFPPDMVKPLELWECRFGQNFWSPMKQAPDSIRTGMGVSQQRFGVWMYEGGVLTLPAIQLVTDIKIKGLCMQPPIADWDSPLMVPFCGHALAYLVLLTMSGGRGGTMSANYKMKSEEAISQLINQTVRKMAYSVFSRPGFRRGSRSGNRSGY